MAEQRSKRERDKGGLIFGLPRVDKEDKPRPARVKVKI